MTIFNAPIDAGDNETFKGDIKTVTGVIETLTVTATERGMIKKLSCSPVFDVVLSPVINSNLHPVLVLSSGVPSGVIETLL